MPAGDHKTRCSSSDRRACSISLRTRSSRSTERTMAKALRRSSSSRRMLQAVRRRTPPADDEGHAEQPTRDQVGDLLVLVRAVRGAVPAEEDADEPEGDHRHAEDLEPATHVRAAALAAGPLDDGGQAAEAGVDGGGVGVGGSVGLTAAVGRGQRGRAVPGPTQDGPHPTRVLGRGCLTEQVHAEGPPKSASSSALAAKRSSSGSPSAQDDDAEDAELRRRSAGRRGPGHPRREGRGGRVRRRCP